MASHTYSPGYGGSVSNGMVHEKVYLSVREHGQYHPQRTFLSPNEARNLAERLISDSNEADEWANARIEDMRSQIE